MGKPYRREDSRFWWLPYVDASGKRCLMSSKTEDEGEAIKRLASIRRTVAAEIRAGLRGEGAATLKWYATKWIASRRELGKITVRKEEGLLRHHALPVLGSMLLKDITRDHILDLVTALQKKHTTKRDGKTLTDELLSPRQVLHVYSVLRTLFNDAVAEKLVPATPCTLRARRRELPRKRDKNPGWRKGAVFARDELEMLISDERVPEYRRVFWALLFLGGLRVNEATPRSWRDYDARAEPLGRMAIDSHWDPKAKVLRPGTKTGPARDLPVHPVLAKMLAAWKLGGWARSYGRQPKPEDLIVPNPAGGGFIDSGWSLTCFKVDCEALGLRPRWQHDTRRTFISLTLGDGAQKGLLKWVTHGPESDIMDSYTVPPWRALCEQVSFLKVELLTGRALKLAALSLLRSPKTGEKMPGSKYTRGDLKPYLSPLSGDEGAAEESSAEERAGARGPLRNRRVRGAVANVAGDLTYEARAIAAGFVVEPARGAQ